MNKENDKNIKENPYDPKGKVGRCQQCRQEKALYFWYAHNKFCCKECQNNWMDYMSKYI